MDFITLYNELISIFNKELPESSRLPIEIIFKIIFKFQGLQNRNYITCFNEFKNDIIYNKKKEIIDIDPNSKINCRSAYIEGNEYIKCKKLSKLILKRIFVYRGNNNIDTDIFTTKFNYNALSLYQDTRKELRILNRKLKVCDSRICYLYIGKLGISKLNTSLVTKLLLTPRQNYLSFYEDYLEMEIIKELYIDKNTLRNFNRTELIRFYLKF